MIANFPDELPRATWTSGLRTKPAESELTGAHAMTTLTWVPSRRDRRVHSWAGQRAKICLRWVWLSWMYGRARAQASTFIREKFARKPESPRANVAGPQGPA